MQKWPCDHNFIDKFKNQLLLPSLCCFSWRLHAACMRLPAGKYMCNFQKKSGSHCTWFAPQSLETSSIHIQTHQHPSTNLRARVCVYVCMCVCLCTCVYTCVCVCVCSTPEIVAPVEGVTVRNADAIHLDDDLAVVRVSDRVVVTRGISVDEGANLRVEQVDAAYWCRVHSCQTTVKVSFHFCFVLFGQWKNRNSSVVLGVNSCNSD